MARRLEQLGVGRVVPHVLTSHWQVAATAVRISAGHDPNASIDVAPTVGAIDLHDSGFYSSTISTIGVSDPDPGTLNGAGVASPIGFWPALAQPLPPISPSDI